MQMEIKCSANLSIRAVRLTFKQRVKVLNAWQDIYIIILALSLSDKNPHTYTPHFPKTCNLFGAISREFRGESHWPKVFLPAFLSLIQPSRSHSHSLSVETMCTLMTLIKQKVWPLISKHTQEHDSANCKHDSNHYPPNCLVWPGPLPPKTLERKL